MAGSILQLSLFALGGCIVGLLVGWSVFSATARRQLRESTSAFRAELKKVTRQRDEIANKYLKSKSRIKQLEDDRRRSNADLESVVAKSRSLARNVRTLLEERDKTKIRVSTIQESFLSLRKKSAALQSEFEKSRAFYKRELTKSFEKRKVLEDDIKQARAEQEAFTRLVETSVLEHGSAENMLIAAQLRLGQLDVLQRNVNKLETENAELRGEITRWKQELEARDKDLSKLEELKLHNRQLVGAVEALENSRKEHEADADRYREQAMQSEQESETLKLKLDDLQKGFSDIEAEQREALEDARSETVIPILRNQG